MNRDLEMCSTESKDLGRKGLGESKPDDISTDTNIIARGSTTPRTFLTGNQATFFGKGFTSNIVSFRIVEEINSDP